MSSGSSACLPLIIDISPLTSSSVSAIDGVAPAGIFGMAGAGIVGIVDGDGMPKDVGTGAGILAMFCAAVDGCQGTSGGGKGGRAPCIGNIIGC